MPRSYNSVTRQSLHYFVRPHEGIPEGPVQSRGAWRRADLAASEAWRYRLTGEDVAELDQALDVARRARRSTRDLTKADFPLRRLVPQIARWRAAVHHGLGVQVVHGFPVERWPVEHAEIVFWCLGQHLGVPGVQNRDGEILGHVRDVGASYDDPDVRGYKTSAHLAYHCDAADAVGLLCLQAAKEGGRSRFASSVTVYNEVLRRRPDLAPVLFDTFHLDTRGDGGVNFIPLRPARHARGVLRTFYHGDYYRTSVQHPGAPRLSPAQAELLDLYDAICNEPEVHFEMEFAVGDLQLLSNHTVLHSRTAYVDWEDPARRRHLLRLWLSFDPVRGPGTRWSELDDAARLLGGLAWGRLRDRGRKGR